MHHIHTHTHTHTNTHSFSAQPIATAISSETKMHTQIYLHMHNQHTHTHTPPVHNQWQLRFHRNQGRSKRREYGSRRRKVGADMRFLHRYDACGHQGHLRLHCRRQDSEINRVYFESTVRVLVARGCQASPRVDIVAKRCVLHAVAFAL